MGSDGWRWSGDGPPSAEQNRGTARTDHQHPWPRGSGKCGHLRKAIGLCAGSCFGLAGWCWLPGFPWGRRCLGVVLEAVLGDNRAAVAVWRNSRMQHEICILPTGQGNNKQAH